MRSVRGVRYVPVSDGRGVRYHAPTNAHPGPACCVAQPPEEDHRDIRNDASSGFAGLGAGGRAPHFGSAAEPAAVDSWVRLDCGWNAADVPTMYHAIGKQR
jgi:hypothetical protein